MPMYLLVYTGFVTGTQRDDGYPEEKVRFARNIKELAFYGDKPKLDQVIK